MSNLTPLRYPGGKARLFKYFHRIISQNALYDCRYVEPFCGGAGLAIGLLRGGVVDSIHLNDFDRAVYAFWSSAVHQTDALCEKIERTPCSMETWHECRDVYQCADTAPLLDLGYATFFLNRTNRSGILKAGVIGGLKQTGKWKLDARLNVPDLLDRIQRIGQLESRITVTQWDATDLVASYSQKDDYRTLIYLDPPYVDKGPGLYLNAYEKSDHERLAKRVEKLKCNWVVSYDDHPLIRSLYDHYRSADLSLHYSAQEHRRVGRERIYFSDSLLPPDMSDVKSRYRMPWAA